MTDLFHSALPRKKRQKLVKQLYNAIEEEVGELKNQIKESSPLADFWNTEQTQEDKDNIKLIANEESRYEEEGKIL